jgi:hypothetical protein
MTDENQQPASEIPQGQLDPQFFNVVNEYLELTNKHAKEHGLKRISMASMYAAARFNAHAYMAAAGADVAKDRQPFLDYMTKLYRQMLNEHLDGLGHERGVDTGPSELKAEIERLNAQREEQGLPRL